MKEYTVDEIEKIALDFKKMMQTSKYLSQPSKDIICSAISDFIRFVYSYEFYNNLEVNLNDK